MRILIQRTNQASVEIAGEVISTIGRGLLVLVGISPTDTDEDIDYLAQKLIRLRIFDDEKGIMNLSVTDIDGELMVVSQFTLQANTRKGNRPSYIEAAKAEFSKPMYDKFCEKIAEMTQKSVKKGKFGHDMKISLINDGPVTIWIDSKNR